MTPEELQGRFKAFSYRHVPLCEALPSKKSPGLSKISFYDLAFPQRPTTVQLVKDSPKKRSKQSSVLLLKKLMKLCFGWTCLLT